MALDGTVAPFLDPGIPIDDVSQLSTSMKGTSNYFTTEKYGIWGV